MPLLLPGSAAIISVVLFYTQCLQELLKIYVKNTIKASFSTMEKGVSQTLL